MLESLLRRTSMSALAGLWGCADDGGATGGDASSTAMATAASDATHTTTETGPDPVTSSGADSTGDPPPGFAVVAELDLGLGMAMSVWGPSAAEAMVVGGQQGDGPSTGFVLRRTPDGWQPDALPAGTPMLDWIGRAGDDVWAVGLAGAALRREDEVWVAHTTGVDTTLWGVWGSTSDDVWAVGGDGVAEPPTLLHFDGARWSNAALPVLPRDAHALFKVWGADAAHVYVAGDAGVLLRRIGDAWEVTTPGSIAPFIALWGRGPDEVVAVGGRSNARLARWDGAAWQDATLMPAGLNGVWVADDGTATLVGRLGGIFELPAGSLEPVPIESPTALVLHAVHGFTDGSRVAVGGSFDSAPPWVGVVVEHPGTT
jgi:hypothetical protein